MRHYRLAEEVAGEEGMQDADADVEVVPPLLEHESPAPLLP
jgi:hypothetical protein